MSLTDKVKKGGADEVVKKEKVKGKPRPKHTAESVTLRLEVHICQVATSRKAFGHVGALLGPRLPALANSSKRS